MSTAQELIEKGKAELLLDQLDELFGPLSADLKARVAAASTQEVALWSRAVLRAERLEDVFEAGAKPASRRTSRRGKGGSKKKR